MPHRTIPRGPARRPAARALAIDAHGARIARLRESFTIATLTLAALATLALSACSGTGDGYNNQAPARNAGEEVVRGEKIQGSDLGEVETQMNGVGINPVDSTNLQGTAGSGTNSARYPSGSIGTPGSGVMEADGDPSDAAVRALVDVIHTGEVQTSEVAQQKAQHPAVKRYAQAMLAAHRGPAAARPAGAGGVAGTGNASNLATFLIDAQRKSLQQLQSLPAGPQFDEAYVRGQIDAHQGALQALERAETAADDATLTDQVRRLQTEVERHLAEARRVQRELQSAQARTQARP